MTCPDPLYFHSSYFTCTALCDSNEYTVDTTCIRCDNTCLTCSGGAVSDCLTCDTHSAFNLYHSTSYTCSSSCDTNEYLSGNTCLPCHTSCATCDGGYYDECLTCAGSLYFHSS